MPSFIARTLCSSHEATQADLESRGLQTLHGSFGHHESPPQEYDDSVSRPPGFLISAVAARQPDQPIILEVPDMGRRNMLTLAAEYHPSHADDKSTPSVALDRVLAAPEKNTFMTPGSS